MPPPGRNMSGKITADDAGAKRDLKHWFGFVLKIPSLGVILRDPICIATNTEVNPACQLRPESAVALSGKACAKKPIGSARQTASTLSGRGLIARAFLRPRTSSDHSPRALRHKIPESSMASAAVHPRTSEPWHEQNQSRQRRG
jgi:hypothetical protein